MRGPVRRAVSPATRRCPPRGQAGDDGGSLQVFCILQILGGLPSVCLWPVSYILYFDRAFTNFSSQKRLTRQLFPTPSLPNEMTFMRLACSVGRRRGAACARASSAIICGITTEPLDGSAPPSSNV